MPTAGRASATTARLPPASASTRGGSGGASGSSISTTTAGSISSSSTATSIPKSIGSSRRRATSSGRSCIGTSATGASRTSPSASARRSRPRRRPRRGVRRSRQRRRHRHRRQQRPRRRRICSGSIRAPDARWLTLKLVGTQSNRSAIGARVRLVTAGGTQVQEVRGGGSYYSQNDLRVHFGLGRSTARRARGDALAERSRGAVDRTSAIDRIVTLKEGTRHAPWRPEVMAHCTSSSRCGRRDLAAIRCRARLVAAQDAGAPAAVLPKRAR